LGQGLELRRRPARTVGHLAGPDVDPIQLESHDCPLANERSVNSDYMGEDVSRHRGSRTNLFRRMRTSAAASLAPDSSQIVVAAGGPTGKNRREHSAVNPCREHPRSGGVGMRRFVAALAALLAFFGLSRADYVIIIYNVGVAPGEKPAGGNFQG